MSKKCENCGNHNIDSAKFCENCGNSLDNKGNAENKLNTSGLNAFWNKQSSKSKILIGLGFCCLGIIIIGLVGGILSPDLNTSNTTLSTSNASTTTPAATSKSEFDGWNDYSNNFISFKYPSSLTVVDRTISTMQFNLFLDPVGIAKPEDAQVNFRLWDDGESTKTARKEANTYISDFQSESPAFKVLKKEDITISGQPAVLLEYKDTDPLSDNSNGPVYKYGVTFLFYKGHQYRFEIEPLKGVDLSDQQLKEYESIIKTISMK